VPILDLSGATLPRQIVGFAYNQYTTFEEDHADVSVITQHPVDTGAVMSDHIFFMPPEVRCRVGWSNCDLAAGTPTYVRNVYVALLQLKNSRQLFQLYTGKRLYNNMAIGELRGPRTDVALEFSLVIDIQFKQLLLVSLASATQAPTATNAAANPAPNALANPATNTPTQTGGFNQLTTGVGPTQIPSGSSGADEAAAPEGLPLAAQTNSNAGGVSDPAALAQSFNPGG
jgi:hypothetical protein